MIPAADSTSLDEPQGRREAAFCVAFSREMIWLGVWRRGEIQRQYPDDAKRSSFIRRKEL